MTGQGAIIENDRRNREDLSRKHGSGGLLAPCRYMLSMTWSAPEAALTEADQKRLETHLAATWGNNALSLGGRAVEQAAAQDV